MNKLLIIFLDWTIAMLIVSAYANVIGLESVTDLGVWRFLVIVGFLYLMIQFLRYKITGKVPW